MRDAVLPDALLAAAVGMALSYAPRPIAIQSSAAMAVAAIAVAALPISGVSADLAFCACWLSLITAAASVHLPGLHGPLFFRLLALNAGVWAGLVTHVQGGVTAAAIALPLVLLFIPGQILVRRNWGIAIKVACSWLIAIAALEIGLLFVPTPGYAPDHMD